VNRETADRGSRAHGFTLLELLVVMTILAVLLGLTVGGLARAGKGGVLDSAARVLRSGLHRARAVALAGGTLSFVTVSPPAAPGGPGFVRTLVSRTAGSWNFDGDDPSVGGDGSTVRLIGASAVPGRVRNGLSLTPVSRVLGPSLDRAPTHDPRLGFSVEMWIRPTGPGPIAKFGGADGDSAAFALRLNEDGSLAAEATVRAENSSVKAETRPLVIEMGQWARVGVSHDGVEFAITAHNVVEARTPDLHEIDVPQDGALQVGGFVGIVDDVVYRTVSELDPFEIDRQVSVDLKYPTTIRFNRDGRLNERFHAEPVVIPLSHEGRAVIVTVDYAGVIR
jgi:prepilin-type N-terminal cleavage/methylation domain-containing protein